MKTPWPANASHTSVLAVDRPPTELPLRPVLSGVQRIIHGYNGAQVTKPALWTIAGAHPRGRSRARRERGDRRAQHAPAGAGARRVADERLPLLPGQGRPARRDGRRPDGAAARAPRLVLARAAARVAR